MIAFLLIDRPDFSSFSNKITVLFMLALIVLTIYSWGKDIRLFKSRRRKYGRKWKPIRGPLVIEIIIIIVLILFLLWAFL